MDNEYTMLLRGVNAVSMYVVYRNTSYHPSLLVALRFTFNTNMSRTVQENKKENQSRRMRKHNTI